MSFILVKQEETGCDFKVFCEQKGLDPDKVAWVVPKHNADLDQPDAINLHLPLDKIHSEKVLLKLWRAVGCGYHLLLPVRHQTNFNYFDDHFPIDEAAYEPDFWETDSPPNKAVAAIYMAEFKRLQQWFEANAPVEKKFFYSHLPTQQAAEIRWEALQAGFNKQNKPKKPTADTSPDTPPPSVNYTTCVLLGLGAGLIAGSVAVGLLFAFPPAGLSVAAMAGIVTAVTVASSLLGGISGYFMEKRRMKKEKLFVPLEIFPKEDEEDPDKIWTLDVPTDDVHYSLPNYRKKAKKPEEKQDSCRIACQIL